MLLPYEMTPTSSLRVDIQPKKQKALARDIVRLQSSIQTLQSELSRIVKIVEDIAQSLSLNRASPRPSHPALSLTHRLMKHGCQLFGKIGAEEAWEEFWSWENEGSFAKAQAGDDISLQLFLPYFLYHWTPDLNSKTLKSAPKDTTVAANFLKTQGRKLTKTERSFAISSLVSPFSFHDVLRFESGMRIRIKDIFLGTEATVFDPEPPHDIKQGDILFGKVIPIDSEIDSEATLCDIGWVSIPRSRRQTILDLRRSLRDAPCRNGEAITADTLHDYDIEIREVFLKHQRSLLGRDR